MDIKQIRLQNLRSLILETGTIAKLARLSETAPAYLSQILNSLPTSTGKPRSVGDKLARKLELAVNKSYGWMDKDHSEAEILQTIPQVPVLDVQQALRHLNHLQTLPSETFPLPLIASDRAFAMRVWDDTMSAKFLPGDIIVIDPEVSPGESDYVIASLNDKPDELIFRQFKEKDGLPLLVALNALHTAIPLNGKDEIIGKVIYRGEIF